MKRKLNSLKIDDIDSFKNSLIESNVIFLYDINGLARYFLSNYLEIDISKLTFDKIKGKFLENISFKEIKDTDYIKEIEDACSNSNKFYAYICKKYLDIIYSPKGIFDSEIKKIEEKKKEFQDKINNIETKINNIKTEEDYDNKPLLKLRKSEYEKHIEHLDNYSKKRIYNKCRELFYLKATSHLDMNIETSFFSPYNHFTIHILANKLHDLSAGDYEELVEEYDKNPKNIIKLMKKFIPEVSIIEIKNRLYKNKQLNDKKELILSLLELYEKKQYLMFITAPPSIIEGIFYDLCILFNVPLKELFGNGLSHKLNKLKDCFNSFKLFYPYYFYNFRIIRNKIAHGKLSDINDIEWHYLLLLDLRHASELLFKYEIPSNLKILLIKKIHESINNNCNKYLFDYIVRYTTLYDIKIDTFYKLDGEIKFVEDYINNNFNELFKRQQTIENIFLEYYIQNNKNNIAKNYHDFIEKLFNCKTIVSSSWLPEYEDIFKFLPILFKNSKFKMVYYDENIYADIYGFWGTRPIVSQFTVIKNALYNNKNVAFFEMGFINSIYTFDNIRKVKNYSKVISYVFDDLAPYYGARYKNRLEEMLNDKKLKLDDKQIERAKLLIDKIIKNKISKYNHQPIYKPEIGKRKTKILVIDQSYAICR